MSDDVVRIEVAGEPLRLLPERAVLLEASRTLLIADAHFGKSTSFRTLGVPVPGGTTTNALQRIDVALERTGAGRIVFLGDFLHARTGRSPSLLAQLSAWRERHADVAMTLVRGNHDRRAGDPPDSLGVSCIDEPAAEPPFLLAHHPVSAGSDSYVLAGHLHPGVRLTGTGRQRLRLPCFWFGRQVGVLPAFGDFTGLAPIDAARGDRVFAIAGTAVLDVSPR